MGAVGYYGFATNGEIKIEDVENGDKKVKLGDDMITCSSTKYGVSILIWSTDSYIINIDMCKFFEIQILVHHKLNI